MRSHLPTITPPPPIPPVIPPDPDLRPIDLAASASPDRLDDEARLHLARAGQDALDACLRRFAPEERAAFWHAICRCYNRPYNPAETPPAETSPAGIPTAEIPPAEIPPAEIPLLGASLTDAARQTSPGPVPAPHVIEAVRPGRDGALPEAALR